MSATIELSSIFARYTKNNLNIQVEGKTIGECIQDMVRQFPDIKKLILDKDGNLMHSYGLYLNGENVYPLEMTRPVKDGDKINLVFIVHGG